MKTMLITGGTVFVSRFAAEYFAKAGWQVCVLNRNTKPQAQGVTLIEADRHALGDCLKGKHFDAVADITAYDAQDVNDLLDALGSFDDYLLISSSAVYPQGEKQPFTEETPVGDNRIWGKYGTDKIAAENALLSRVPGAYVIRPPYLYGPMNNVYREAFVFDCAIRNRKFYLPKERQLPLQFFHVEDLCRFMEILLDRKPEAHIYNVGNPEAVSVARWVELCYEAVGAPLETISVTGHPQRSFFSFHDYEYMLDVSKQTALMPEVKALAAGVAESYAWFKDHREEVTRKPYFEYIDQFLR